MENYLKEGVDSLDGGFHLSLNKNDTPPDEADCISEIRCLKRKHEKSMK